MRPGSQRWRGGAPAVPPAVVLWGLQCVPLGGHGGVCWYPAMLGGPWWQRHWHSCALSEMTLPHILAICYLLTSTGGGCIGWCLLGSRTCLSWLVFVSLAALAQAATCFQPKPAGSSLLIFKELCRQAPCRVPALSCVLQSWTGVPRVSPAAVLREKAGLAGQPRLDSTPLAAQLPRICRAGLLKGLGVNTTLLFSLSEGPLCWHEFLFSWRSESSFD